MPLKPTEYLTHVEIEKLSQLSIFLLVQRGFSRQDVWAMVSISKLYSSPKVIDRIIGKQNRKNYNKTDETIPRLSAAQSAIAFQFAKILEQAMTVFGSILLAEEWLKKPCRHLEDHIPLDLIDSPLGFKIVEDYLERMMLGIYQ